MSAQVDELTLQAQELAATAQQLRGLARRFRLRQQDVQDEIRDAVLPLFKAA